MSQQELLRPARTAQPLGYSAPATQRGSNPKRPLYIALGCGLLPAVVGTAVISLWLLTRHGSLPLFGLFTIFLGLACTLVGAVFLVIHFNEASAGRSRPTRSWRVRGLLAGALLLGNFPLCAFYIWAAGLYTVRVVNAAGGNVSSFVVSDPAGQRWEMGPVAPGTRKTRLMDFNGEGAVTFSANVNGTVVTGDVDGYITSGMDGKTRTVTVNPDGTVSVR